MCSYPLRVAAGVLAAAAMLSGCSSEASSPAPSGSPAAAPKTTEPPPLPVAAPPANGAVKVSPGGVTTAVDVPSDATESQYGQACHAAKTWMDAQHSDPKALVEPYLKSLQQPGASTAGNFNTPWAKLTPAQQAGVILAVQGAANGDCG